MADPYKICPECGAEYFPHITTCASCEVPLIFQGEEPKHTLPKAEGSLVCVEEGDFERVTELSRGLKKAGVDCQVLNMGKAGKTCSSNGGYGIFVSQSIARTAVKEIEALYQRLYPELREIETRMDEGCCPACGSPISQNDAECPDCGLNLSGPGGGGHSSCGGGCGPC